MAIEMEAIIARATGNGTYQVTRNQLLTAYLQLSAQSNNQGCFRLFVALGFIFVGAPVAVIMGSQLGAGFAVFASGVLLSWHMWPGGTPEAFDKCLDRYLAGGGQIPALLNPQAVATAPPGAPEPDIYSYGVQRILIVDDDAAVDLLVRNNFHAQHQVAITSINGYPSYLSAVISRLLANPQVKIYLLHQAEGSNASAFNHRVVSDPRIGQRGENILNCGFTHANVASLPLLAAVPKSLKKTLPVDMIPYAALSGLLAQAIGQHKSITAILAERAALEAAAKRQQSQSSTSSYFAGGGHDFG
jgi:hypothetical protein